jgi:hypothetical protein
MKATDNFKKLIEQHLKRAAQLNSLFEEKLKNPKKNIDDCVTYILNQVKKSGMNGFEDTEIYGMAMHYYDEENVKPGDKLTNGQVIVNHHMELTDEEVAEIKKQAKDKMIAKEISRLEKKPEKTDFKKEEKKQGETLF